MLAKSAVKLLRRALRVLYPMRSILTMPFLDQVSSLQRQATWHDGNVTFRELDLSSDELWELQDTLIHLQASIIEINRMLNDELLIETDVVQEGLLMADTLRKKEEAQDGEE